jgi:hypothetical protein
MTEDFLYYIWQYKNYKHSLKTIDGRDVKVLSVGERNYGSGPDFSAAKVEIDNTIWCGNIEMHIKSSDWIKHGHDKDEAYDSVILHFVYENDMDIITIGGNMLDVVEIKGNIKESQYVKYKELLGSRNWISCSNQINKVQDIILYSWLDRLLIERLERKTEEIEQSLIINNNNWEQTFYIYLARSFGFNTNSDAFEQLASLTPIDVLARYKDSIFQIEALLFGQSSLISAKLNDEYSKELIAEYNFLKTKHKLQSVFSYQWKFLRMRPVNFPSIRIAQFAQLIHKSSHLFSSVISAYKLEDLSSFFDVETSEYWRDHYVFGKKTKSRKKAFGKSSFDLILINTIVPFLFVYANHQGDDALKQRALMFLQHTKPESNSIVKAYTKEGVIAHNAAQSQALLELKNNYCKYQKCLQCAIGLQLVSGR